MAYVSSRWVSFVLLRLSSPRIFPRHMHGPKHLSHRIYREKNPTIYDLNLYQVPTNLYSVCT